MKYLSKDAYDYLGNTYGLFHSHEVDDVTMFWESDYPELAAKLLYDAGAIEPVCREARELIEVAKSVTCLGFRRILRKVIKNYTVVECGECNAVFFIPRYCEPKDWVESSCESCGKKGTCKMEKKK